GVRGTELAPGPRWASRQTLKETPGRVAGASSGRIPLPLWMSCAVVGPSVAHVRDDVRLWFERRLSRAADWPGSSLVTAKRGKGEVLWRSLAATSADVIVFVDSDLRDFSTTFVTGLLGPLLTDPTVQFVKATYDRPLQSGETVAPAGGGRVTELVARPLINMYWPELAGFVQPLGGEYAARRSLLERLPFPCGYGVEFGLLVDSLAAVGLEAMAQVDLVRRKHRNSSVTKLGRMAAEIIQVAMDRLEGGGGRTSAARRASLLATSALTG